MSRKQEKGVGEARKEEWKSMRGHKYISKQLSIRKAHAGNQHSSCSVERLGTEPLLWELFSCLLQTSLCFKWLWQVGLAVPWKSNTEGFLAVELCLWPFTLSLSCQDRIEFKIKGFQYCGEAMQISLSLFSFHTQNCRFSAYTEN